MLDTSTLVSAAFKKAGVPAQAVERALRSNRVAVSIAVMAELLNVLNRPDLARFVDQDRRLELVEKFTSRGIPFTPAEAVSDCRDPKDNKFLELALAAEAGLIVSSDADLLVLDPWRGVRIMRPAVYLAEAGS